MSFLFSCSFNYSPLGITLSNNEGGSSLSLKVDLCKNVLLLNLHYGGHINQLRKVVNVEVGHITIDPKLQYSLEFWFLHLHGANQVWSEPSQFLEFGNITLNGVVPLHQCRKLLSFLLLHQFWEKSIIKFFFEPFRGQSNDISQLLDQLQSLGIPPTSSFFLQHMPCVLYLLLLSIANGLKGPIKIKQPLVGFHGSFNSHETRVSVYLEFLIQASLILDPILCSNLLARLLLFHDELLLLFHYFCHPVNCVCQIVPSIQSTLLISTSIQSFTNPMGTLHFVILILRGTCIRSGSCSKIQAYTI